VRYGGRRWSRNPPENDELVTDPRKEAAETAGLRHSRRWRHAGWLLAVLAWAIASDARVVLAVVAVVIASVVVGAVVITTGYGKGRAVFWSPWLFATAALGEVVWLVGFRSRI
jgi:hypothetical protein